MNLREGKKGTFLFILSFIGFIVLIVVGLIIKDVFQSVRANDKVDYYYGEIISQEIKNPPFDGAKPHYIFIVELRFKGDKKHPIDEKEEYQVSVTEKAYDHYGNGSILKGYFYQNRYYLAGASVDEPFEDSEDN